MKHHSEPKIEKGIPVPPRYTKPVTGKLYVILEKMEVKDSVMIPNGFLASEVKTRGNLSSYARKTKKNFTIRKVEGGLRIWRTK